MESKKVISYNFPAPKHNFPGACLDEPRITMALSQYLAPMDFTFEDGNCWRTQAMTMVKWAPILGIWGPYDILYGEIYPLSWPEPHFQAIWLEIVHPMSWHSSINHLSWRRFTMEISMYRTVWSASGAKFQGEGWIWVAGSLLGHSLGGVGYYNFNLSGFGLANGNNMSRMELAN